jgi:hypothetical protein
MEFDIEKVEALDYEAIKEQLCLIFKEEKDIVAFVNFMQSIQKFANMSSDKRHMSLINLAYFRSQIQLYEKKIQSLIDKKKNEQIRAAIKKAKGCGEKISENVITYYSESNDTLEGLIELHNLVYAWSLYMGDLYFICGQTNKNLGDFN